MGILNNAFNKTIEGRIRNLANGDFRGAFRSDQTVFIEKNPDNPQERILRFGPEKDDYFRVSGSLYQREALCEILAKVIESPTQLKKIKAMPVDQRPELVIENGADFNGCCNGKQIVISGALGTGYRAAATFVHEFQHQYQATHDGLESYKGKLSLAEDILDDRLCESAAETASYQYLYEMKDANPQARNVFLCERETGWYSQGLRDYTAAKEAGSDEASCVLAGMSGYASSYNLARCYEIDYHRNARVDPSRDLYMYADYLHDGLKEQAVEKINRGLGGGRLDEIAAFKSHTVGMMENPPSRERIEETVRSPEYNYVTTPTADTLKGYLDRYRELTGREHSKQDEVFSVRDSGGVRKNTEPEKRSLPLQSVRRSHKMALRLAIYKAKPFLRDKRENLKYNIRSGLQKAFGRHSSKGERIAPRPVVLHICDGENLLLSLDGRKKGLKDFTGALYYKPDLAYKNFRDIPAGANRKLLCDRENKLYDTLSIVLKDEKLRSELTGHGSKNPLTVGFNKNPNIQTDTPSIVLDPRKPAEELARDFRKQYEALKQKESRSVVKQASSLQKGIAEKQKASLFKQISGIYRKRQNDEIAARTATFRKSR